MKLPTLRDGLVVAAVFALAYLITSTAFKGGPPAAAKPEPPEPTPRFSVHPTEVRVGSYTHLGVIVDELTGQQYLYAYCPGYGNRTDAIALTPLLSAPETSKENPHE